MANHHTCPTCGRKTPRATKGRPAAQVTDAFVQDVLKGVPIRKLVLKHGITHGPAQRAAQKIREENKQALSEFV